MLPVWGGADLFESYVGSIIAAIALAVALGYGRNGIVLPMLIAAAGIIASIIGGAFFVRTGGNWGMLLVP